MGIIEGIFSIFAVISKLLDLYRDIEKLVGKAMAEKALNNLIASTKLAIESKKEGLTIEQRREMRRKALQDGHNSWSDVISG